jgi:SAM-dependent methyltransferase
MPPYIEKLLDGISVAKIADIGSGPITTLGTDGGTDEQIKNIRIYPSDYLADEYNKMMDEIRKKAYWPVEKQNMVKLTYPDNKFDIVHCRNALDHCTRPIAALKEMIRVCAPGGKIVLLHYPSMGLRRNYKGMHAWNITLNNKIWKDTLPAKIYDLKEYGFYSQPYGRNDMVLSICRK